MFNFFNYIITIFLFIFIFILFFFGGGGGGVQKYSYFWGHEDCVDIFFFFWGGSGSRQNWTSLRGLFYVFFGSFLKVNVQNENIFEWQRFQIFLGVLDIPDIFWRQTVDAGPNPTYKEKRVSTPPPPHTHTPPGS